MLVLHKIVLTRLALSLLCYRTLMQASDRQRRQSFLETNQRFTIWFDHVITLVFPSLAAVAGGISSYVEMGSQAEND